MAHLIDANKLIAEIERRIEELKSTTHWYDEFFVGQIKALKGVKTIINSLSETEENIKQIKI